ncbi:MAG: hypothetical protein AAGB93_06260 [Planctomycetota bacterium]
MSDARSQRRRWPLLRAFERLLRLPTRDEEPGLISEEVRAVFESAQREEIDPVPLFGDEGFPLPLPRGGMDRSTAALFYPGIEVEAQLYEYAAELCIRPRPSVRMSLPLPDDSADSYEYSTNALAMHRDVEPSAAGVDVRVLVTGASNVQGVCSNGDAATGILETRLAGRRGGATVEVLNAACGAYNFFNYVAVLERFAYLQPDVFVVIAYTGNDFFGSVRMWRLFGGYGAPDDDVVVDPRRLLEDDDPFVRALAGLEVGQIAAMMNNSSSEQHALCASCSATLEIARICHERGIEPLFAVLPSPLTGQPGAMADARARVESLLDLPEGAIDLADRIGDRWLEFLEDRGLRHCDLRPSIRAADERLYFERDGHLNLAGQRVVAETLAPAIEDALAART